MLTRSARAELHAGRPREPPTPTWRSCRPGGVPLSAAVEPMLTIDPPLPDQRRDRLNAEQQRPDEVYAQHALHLLSSTSC